MEDAATSLTMLIINAGIVGTIALVIVIGLGYLLFYFSSKLCKIANKFVVGTLENMGKMVTQMDQYTEVMQEISITQKEIQNTQTRIAIRVEDLHKRP